MTPLQRLLATLILIIVTAYEFAPALNAGFVYQDNRWQSAYEAAPTLSFSPSRFLMKASWYAQAAQSARAFHIANLLLHVSVSVLVGLLVVALELSESVAWIAGAFFLLNPAQAEVAGYISGRSESFAAFGMLLTLIAFARRRLTISTALLACIGLVIAALSKETAIILLVLIPLIRRQWLLATLMLGVLGLLTSYVAAHRLRDVTGYAATANWAWATTQATAFWRTLWTTLSTLDGAVEYDYSRFSAMLKTVSLFALAVFPIIAFRVREQFPIAAIGLMTLFAVILPRLLIEHDTNTFNDHHFYFGRVGVALVLAQAIAFIDESRGTYETT